MLNELSKTIRFDNASKGFDPTEGGVNRYILLTISEICEAQNELRDGHEAVKIYYDGMVEAPYHAGYSLEKFPADKKPEGFAVEIADAYIRLLDIAGKFEIDLDSNKILPIGWGDDPIEDWLLGIVNIIADMHNYTPLDYDFNFALGQAISTIEFLCEHQKIDLHAVVRLKLAYNRTRPPKHGRKF